MVFMTGDGVTPDDRFEGYREQPKEIFVQN
jgi:hypothetical protein